MNVGVSADLVPRLAANGALVVVALQRPASRRVPTFSVRSVTAAFPVRVSGLRKGLGEPRLSAAFATDSYFAGDVARMSSHGTIAYRALQFDFSAAPSGMVLTFENRRTSPIFFRDAIRAVESIFFGGVVFELDFADFTRGPFDFPLKVWILGPFERHALVSASVRTVLLLVFAVEVIVAVRTCPVRQSLIVSRTVVNAKSASRFEFTITGRADVHSYRIYSHDSRKSVL